VHLYNYISFNSKGDHNMLELVKPPHLRTGDLVATVSPSSGIAGDPNTRWRYEQGKRRLEELLGLRVIEMPHTLDGSQPLYEHPQWRASDLMQAFADPNVRGIFSCLGGEDTIRLLPYIDYDLIRANPKPFIGYSDSTVNCFMCLHAGVTSFYGPSVLSGFAENLRMHPYELHWCQQALFGSQPLGEIPVSAEWESEHASWEEADKAVPLNYRPNQGYELLQGSGVVSGPLLGGCIEVMDWLRGTAIWPSLSDWSGALLFFETSEEKPTPAALRYMLRCLGALGVLEHACGMLVGKPRDEAYYEEYKAELVKVLAEFGRSDMPVLYNASFGHCGPRFTLPYGATGEIDCNRKTFSITTSGCA
jgi:muramoyltetrapeptide carboxypeptidase LdcA involved in peptidoglycan recycling